LAKNLKINVKNAQLAQALKLDQFKKPSTKSAKKASSEVQEQPDQGSSVPEKTVTASARPTPSEEAAPRVSAPERPSIEEPAKSAEAPPQPAPQPKAPHPAESTQREELPPSDIARDVDRQSSYREDTQRPHPTYRQPSGGGYPPRRESYTRTPGTFTPSGTGTPYNRPAGGGYPPRREGYPSREQGSPPPYRSSYPPRREGYSPSQGTSGFPPRREAYSPQGGPAGAPRRFEGGPSPYPRRPAGPGASSFVPGSRPPYPPRPRPPYSGPGGGAAGRPPFGSRPFPGSPRPTPDDGKGERKTTRTFATEPRKAPASKEMREYKPGKKQEEKSFDARDRHGLRDSGENEGWRKRRPSHKARFTQQEEIIRPKTLAVRLPTTIKDLAAAMKLKASELIAKLFMKGVVLTLNDILDDETTVQLLGHDFDCAITIDRSEEDRLKITDRTIRQEIQDIPEDQLSLRPPVVAFMGHVDHGKTSLIDAIRKSNVAGGEAGAITQHIGAFKCRTPSGDITILDTPGHEAFSAMRARGADVTDIIVLVVAGDEGIRTQTIEALEQAQAASVPIVVAINKCDKPNFNAENVYRQLADKSLLPEAWGGQTITVNCSAVTGQGIPELLEMLALQAEVLELKANPHTRARGSVIESEMHKGLGAVATVLVKNGTLRLGDAVVFTDTYARVKTMHDEHGNDLEEAGPSTPVKITGLSGIPEAGNEFIVVKSEKEAMDIAEKRGEGQRLAQLHKAKKTAEFIVDGAAGVKKKVLNLILRADVQGSLEALKTSLLKIASDKIELNIVYAGVGEISESDVQFAGASKAKIIGFHTQVESHADSLIKSLNVTVKLHDIIYHAVDDVREIMRSMLDKLAQETDIGAAEVKAIFKASQIGLIAGCSVTDGVIKRSAHVRQVRDGKVIWKGPIHSLKRVKEDVREVSKGYECGIVLQGKSDIKEGDIFQAFEITYIEQDL
jgi:translation initiation factor IF-2